MALITVSQLNLTFGGLPLFENLSLTIESGQRVCLVGRNGVGKSTLLKVLAGTLEPDSGSVARQNGIVIQTMEQGFPEYPDLSVRQVLENRSTSGLEGVKILDQLGIDANLPWDSLSGGSKRKCMLASVLSGQPDLVFLDEPTNHLDLEAIQWLEEYCSKQIKTLVFVTHDRVFARKVGNRILNLDRGKISSYEGTYAEFLQTRDKLLADEQVAWEKQDKVRVQEEEWLRRGVKARRTRDEGRVKALLAMRQDHKNRRLLPGQVKTTIQTGIPSGKLVAELENVTFRYPTNEKDVLRDLNFTVMKGDKIAIVGPNGSGKTTLVKLLVGELTPTKGQIRLGTNLSLLYYDQSRADLDPEKTLLENLSGSDDAVIVRGKSKHVNAYAQDFLFSPDRLSSPVFTLSGGEQNRLVLAKLFARPGNMLVFDEPTNDLDSETLELLEALLVDYEGTVLLVSHDREFIDNVASDCLVLLADGKVHHHVGSYTEYQQNSDSNDNSKSNKPNNPTKKTGIENSEKNRTLKLSYKEQKELEGLPSILEELEEKIAIIHTQLADPSTYGRGNERGRLLTLDLERLENDREKSYSRWQELEEKFEESKQKTD